MLNTKFQPNIQSNSEEKADFSGLAIFSISDYFLFSTRLKFNIKKLRSLVMLQMKFESHGCSGFR